MRDRPAEVIELGKLSEAQDVLDALRVVFQVEDARGDSASSRDRSEASPRETAAHCVTQTPRCLQE